MWFQTSKNRSDEQLVNGENKLKAYVFIQIWNLGWLKITEKHQKVCNSFTLLHMKRFL